MIARPKISRNERKTTEIGAFEVGHVAPFCCPGDDVAVAAIVKRIVRHLNMKDDAVCTLADFEASAAHIAHEILHEAKVPAAAAAGDVDLPWGKVQPIHQRDGGDDRSASVTPRRFVCW
ncbi:hypothetical protein JL722_2695 [Aureococcus anophagefferens]|nr:hypothetical protein JL722_2695 [Aureococcus anophagefferens]